MDAIHILSFASILCNSWPNVVESKQNPGIAHFDKSYLYIQSFSTLEWSS